MSLKQTKKEQRGFVVVLTLCMVMMLAVLLIGFNCKSRANLRAVDDFRKSQHALNCARAGLNIAIAVLRNDSETYKDKTLTNLLSAKDTIAIDDGNCSITVARESGKLNVNLLKDKNDQLNRTAIDQLLRLIDLLNRDHADTPHISYGLVPSIIDWTDIDDKPTYLPFVKHENSGAESSYYSTLKPAYRCKNAPLDTARELLLVRGLTPQVFERIRDYITVCGDGKININFASKCVIESLSEKMDPALAQMVIDRRKIKPFDAVTELRNVPGMTDDIYNTIKQTAAVGSDDRYYHIASRGQAGYRSCTIVAILEKNTKTKNIEVILYEEL